MTHTARSGFLAAATAAVVFALAAPAWAAQGARPAQPGRTLASVPSAAPGDVVADEYNAMQTREQFYEVLDKYPPNLGRVLKLDPSLLTNESYLAPYPSLASFLAQHPDIPRNPAYFLERVSMRSENAWAMDEQSIARRDRQDVLAGIAAFFVFVIVTGVVVWVIRTVVESRRWNRVSKTQFDVHSKLLERFTTNEELLAYIQTPVGRRFLESGPAPLPGGPVPVGAPFSRILWSVQVGVILLLAGAGLLFLSSRMNSDPALFFLVFGVLSLSLGGGFVASGGAAWALSRRLGLLDRSDVDHA